MSSFVNRVCVNEICCTHGDDSCKVQHYIKVNSLLTESPWFQRSGGSDHIIVLSHFGIPQFLREHSRPATDGSPGINVSAILACNRVAFEDRDYLNRWHDGKLDQTHYTPYPGLEPVPKWRLDPNLNSGLPVNLPTLYVGTECTATPLSERNKSFAFVGKVGNPNWANAGHMARLKMCDTFAANDNPFRSTATCSGKGYKKQCKSRLHRIPGIKCSGLSICSAFQGSKYGLHVQGDSPTSNRLIDIIASELVPVFTGGEIQYDLLPFQELIPWKELSERAYMTEHTPSKMWVNVLESFAYDDARYERKLKLVQAYKEYLTWKPGNFKPFEMYMVEFYFRLAQLQQDQNHAKELRSRMARFQKHRDKLGEPAYAWKHIDAHIQIFYYFYRVSLQTSFYNPTTYVVGQHNYPTSKEEAMSWPPPPFLVGTRKTEIHTY